MFNCTMLIVGKIFFISIILTMVNLGGKFKLIKIKSFMNSTGAAIELDIKTANLIEFIEANPNLTLRECIENFVREQKRYAQ